MWTIPRVKGCQNGCGPLGTSTMTCRSARPLEWAAPLQRSLAGAPPRYATDARVRRLRTTKPSPTAPIIGNVIIILIMIIRSIGAAGLGFVDDTPGQGVPKWLRAAWHIHNDVPLGPPP